MEVISNTVNKVLKRRELSLRIVHDKSATPPRTKIKEMLVSEFRCDPNLVAITAVRTPTGKNESIVNAFIYESKEHLMALTPHYVRGRDEPKKAKEKMKPKEEGEKKRS